MNTMIKLVLAFFSWEPVLKLLLQFAFSYLGKVLSAEHLSLKQKYFIQDVDAVNRTLGDKWAKETKSGIDDELVYQVKNLAETIATKHNFQLHILGQVF
jgi:hypothetical protein